MNDRELTSKEIAEVRLKYPPGTRLMLIIMEDSYAVPSGTRETVDHVDDVGQIHMNWDNGRSLAIVPQIDQFRKLTNLKPGQSIIVDTGNVAGFEPSVQMDIQQVHGVKNIFFGGEGLFNTVLTGPGRVWLQTMPIYNVANAIRPYIPTGGNN